jgi:hypothetical protein
MNEVWPWLLLAGLGAFHGLNPAMGWLFAVALGLHRRSLAEVLWALPPIALGHLLSVVLVAGAVIASGVVIEGRWLYAIAAVMLIGWGIYIQIYGHRHRVRVGMMAGFGGLLAWSFLMATAHGAGLMLLPAIIPLCFGGSPIPNFAGAGSAGIAIAAVGVHTGAMLTVVTLIAVAVYKWLGLAVLRTAWLNFDRIWSAALVATGLILLIQI